MFPALLPKGGENKMVDENMLANGKACSRQPPTNLATTPFT